MALVKRIVLFLITLLFINILLFGATNGFAKNTMGLGIGTRSCNDFIYQTVEMSDNGELTDRALMTRLEYLQWANGFMNGMGTFTWSDGSQKSGIWQNGKLQE